MGRKSNKKIFCESLLTLECLGQEPHYSIATAHGPASDDAALKA